MNRDRLREKGWSDEEIQRAAAIMGKNPRRVRLVDEALYWAILCLGVFTMIGVSVWVIPVFVFGTATILYPLLVIIALSFGVLFQHLVRDLDHLTLRHHVILSSVIPLVGITSFLVVIRLTNEVGNRHSALLAGVIFTSFFILPYAHHLRRNHGHR